MERYNIVYGCSNFYKKGPDDTTYCEEVRENVENEEYDVQEPSEIREDPVVPNFGLEFKMDDAGNGPSPLNTDDGEPMLSTKGQHFSFKHAFDHADIQNEDEEEVTISIFKDNLSERSNK